MSELRRIWARPALVAGAVIVADQISKAAIWRLFGPTPVEGTSVPVIDPWLLLTFTKNQGVAFGMLQNMPQILTIVSIMISLGALYYYRFYLPNQKPLVQICIGLVVGGAVGNIIDRLRLGYVTDFVHITWFPGIFNVADSAITCGTLLLAGFVLLLGDRAAARPAAGDDGLLSDLLSRDRWPRPDDRR